jgi:polyhydroxyalkanoate synthesis repressor PhaR
MAEARVIKRYANRKLYDTQHSRYVTLDQISEMIRAGDEVKIVDNKTKEDLTSVTLAQIIFEEEKKQRSFMPLGAMRNIIQNGGEWFAEAQRRVTSVLPFKRGEDEPPPEAEPEDDAGDEARRAAGAGRAARVPPLGRRAAARARRVAEARRQQGPHRDRRHLAVLGPAQGRPRAVRSHRRARGQAAGDGRQRGPRVAAVGA